VNSTPLHERDAHATPGPLHAQLQAFREVLVPGLSEDDFADMYAQTIAYGLFAARHNHFGSQPFARQSAAWDLPKTNPFLQKLFNEIAGPALDSRIAWIVDDLAHLLAVASMDSVMQDFAARTGREDPVVHFYETFLREYDPKLREVRGVYYTPEPVVSYIVRSVDHILKTEFDMPDGLADERVFILDPACGTGTFLFFTIRLIHDFVVAKYGGGPGRATCATSC
jgi:predicted helicase